MLMCYELMRYELMCYVWFASVMDFERLDALKYCVGIFTDVVMISIDLLLMTRRLVYSSPSFERRL